MESDSRKRLSLSKKGEELIDHYENMVGHGYQRADEVYVKNTYEDFGAGEGIRTLDFNLGKVALYP